MDAITENPLRAINLRDDIVQPINRHIEDQNSFYVSMFDSPNYVKNFYFFLCGLLSSIRCSQDDDLLDIYIWKVTSDYSTIQAIAVFKDMTIVHDIEVVEIMSSKSKTTTRLSKELYSALRKLLLGRHSIQIEDIIVKHKQYKIGVSNSTGEKHAKVPEMMHFGHDMENVSLEVIFSMGLGVGYGTPLLYAFEVERLCQEPHKNVFRKFMRTSMRENALACLNFSKSMNIKDKESESFFANALLLRTMPGPYYKKLLQFTADNRNKLPLPHSPSLFLLPSELSQTEYVLIDFSDNPLIQEAYIIVSNLATDSQIHLIRPIYRQNKGLWLYQERTLRWSLLNILSNLAIELKNIKNDIKFSAWNAVKAAYSDVLKNRFNMFTLEQQDKMFKFYLYGELKMASPHTFFIDKRCDAISQLNEMVIRDGNTAILLVFNTSVAGTGSSKTLPKIEKAGAFEVKFENSDISIYGMNSGGGAPNYGQFYMVPPSKVDVLLSEVASRANTPEIPEILAQKFSLIMNNFLRDAMNLHAQGDVAISVYLRGAFSKYKIVLIEQQGELHSVTLFIRNSQNIPLLFTYFLFADETRQVSAEIFKLAEWSPHSPNHRFYIAYNHREENDKIAVLATSVSERNGPIITPYTTKNVYSYCRDHSQQSDTSRTAKVICPLIDRKVEKLYKKKSFQELIRSAKENYPHVCQQLSEIHNFNTKTIVDDLSLDPILDAEDLGIKAAEFLNKKFIVGPNEDEDKTSTEPTKETADTLEQVMNNMPLTTAEVKYFMIRSFYGFPVDKSLENIAEQVMANEMAVIGALHAFPEVRRLVLSAAIKVDNKTGSLGYFEDNTISLTTRHDVEMSRAMPRKDKMSSKYKFFCTLDEANPSGLQEMNIKIERYLSRFAKPFTLMGQERNETKFSDFHCVNAFGIENTKSSCHDNVTLFLLFNGNDNVTAFPSSPNVMVLGNGHKTVRAGNYRDSILFIGDATFGYLDGLDGEDMIDFSQYANSQDSTVMILENSILTLQRGDVHISPKLIVKNFEIFIGRKDLTDHVVACNHTKIDLRGAASKARPDIITSDPGNEMCDVRNLTIYLRNNTEVSCEAENASIKYIVARDEHFTVSATMGSHYFIFIKTSLTEMFIRNESGLIMMYIGEGAEQIIIGTEESEMEFLFIQEDILMKFSGQNFTANVVRNMPFFEIMHKYAAHLRKNPDVSLMSNTSHGILWLSHNYSTIQYNDRQNELNIVLMEDKDQKFRLHCHPSKDNYILINDDSREFGKLSPYAHTELYITIDVTLTKQNQIYIDLSYFRSTRNGFDAALFDVSITLNTDRNDVEIHVLATNQDDFTETKLATVRVLDGLTHMDQITTYLWIEKKLTHFVNEFSIQSTPIHMLEYNYLIRPDEFKHGSILNFNYEIKAIKPYFVNDTLLITNFLNLENLNDTLIIFKFLDYHVYKRKYDTFQLIFKNTVETLPKLVVKAQDISLFWGEWYDILERDEEGKRANIESKKYAEKILSIENSQPLDLAEIYKFSDNDIDIAN